VARIVLLIVGLFLVGCAVEAQGKPTKEPKQPAIESRVAALEERVATLETLHVPPPTPTSTPTPTPTPIPPIPGPVSWWPGDGNAEDIAGSNAGVLKGDTTFIPGKAGQAFSFDGAGDYIDMGDVLDVGISSFSISLWYKRQIDGGGNRRVISKGLTASGSPPDAGYAITLDGGLLRVTVEDPNQNKVIVEIPEPVLGQFHHAATVIDRDGAVIKLFLDGVMVAQADVNNVGSLDTNQAFGIGASIINGSPTGSFDGAIDEVQFYNRALSADEVNSIFRAVP